FLPWEAPGAAADLAGVPERLEVEQDQVGRGVVLPELEQVVRGDVGLVADRHEGGQAKPARGSALEHRQAQRSALRGEADVPGWEGVRREGRVQTGAGEEEAQAVGADETGAVGPH